MSDAMCNVSSFRAATTARYAMSIMYQNIVPLLESFFSLTVRVFELPWFIAALFLALQSTGRSVTCRFYTAIVYGQP